MIGLAILAGVFFLVLIAGIGALALGAIWFALRAVFWVVLLPFRLLFLAFTLPLLLMLVLAVVGVAIVGGLILVRLSKRPASV